MANTQKSPFVRVSVLKFLAIAIVIIGLGYGIWIAVQKHEASYAGDRVSISEASPQDQVIAEHTIRNFLDLLQHHLYDQALQLTTSDYPKPHSSRMLEKIEQTQLTSMMSADTLQFDSAQLASHNRVMYLRGRFHSGGKFYRTVYSLTRNNELWRISNIRPSVEASEPPGKQVIGVSPAH